MGKNGSEETKKHKELVFKKADSKARDSPFAYFSFLAN